MNNISLSQQWSKLSRGLYGENFKEELANFLKKHNSQTILECSCGDGSILYGLAQRGLRGLGIDSDQEMISIALQNNRHSNIEYRLMNLLDVDKLPTEYDAVLCRGGSIITIKSWRKNKSGFDSLVAEKAIKEGVEKMFRKVKSNGIFYIDTISQSEIDNCGGKFRIKREDICLDVEIEHDLDRKARYVCGKGKIGNKTVIGDSVSYLLSPSGLKELIRDLNPKKVWRPNLKSETNYTAICAVK